MPTYHLYHLAFHQESMPHTLGDIVMENKEPSKNSGLDGPCDLGKLTIARTGGYRGGRDTLLLFPTTH